MHNHILTYTSDAQNDDRKRRRCYPVDKRSPHRGYHRNHHDIEGRSKNGRHRKSQGMDLAYANRRHEDARGGNENEIDNPRAERGNSRGLLLYIHLDPFKANIG